MIFITILSIVLLAALVGFGLTFLEYEPDADFFDDEDL